LQVEHAAGGDLTETVPASGIFHVDPALRLVRSLPWASQMRNTRPALPSGALQEREHHWPFLPRSGAKSVHGASQLSTYSKPRRWSASACSTGLAHARITAPPSCSLKLASTALDRELGPRIGFIHTRCTAAHRQRIPQPGSGSPPGALLVRGRGLAGQCRCHD